MKKSKIISLFLALLMLSTCVLGALFIGAKAQVQTPTVIYTVADYEEEGKEHFTGFSEALQKAASLTWGKDDVLEIRFKGEQVSAGPQGTFDENGNINSTGIQGLLFGQETIWREDGTKLPITIRGINMKSARDSWIYIDAAGGWYTCANDYTFVNLTLPIGDYGTQFFAGSGNITFHECNLYFSSGRLVIHNMDEWYEKTAISTELSEYVAKTYDVDILPINNAANLATQSAAFGDKELGHLLFAASKYEGVDFGDWSHEGDVGGGQYLYACVLFETLTRQSCIGNTFRPSYKLKYSDMTWEELQQIAHKAVEEQYGKGYCNGQMPADIGGDDIFNFLLVGSSNAYYCIDELASIARAAGVNMKVHHAYYSSIPIKKILNQEGYSMQVWYDADGNGAVKSSEMSSFKNLSTILPAK
ncbi:MAG: hypothetical protein IKU24_05880, partial [Clostridia bacterium]|nr:hypothetical protein [Clostridia bacterium]